jgi:hypothetical protein
MAKENLCGIRFGFLPEAREPNRIPHKIAFLRNDEARKKEKISIDTH